MGSKNYVFKKTCLALILAINLYLWNYCYEILKNSNFITWPDISKCFLKFYDKMTCNICSDFSLSGSICELENIKIGIWWQVSAGVLSNTNILPTDIQTEVTEAQFFFIYVRWNLHKYLGRGYQTFFLLVLLLMLPRSL